MSGSEHLILIIVGSIVAIGLGVAVPLIAIWTEHLRKMAGLAHSEGATGNEELRRLRDEFNTLRESVTSHAMSVDENLKALAGRVNGLEQRQVSAPALQELSGGQG
jgi:hypothetical protein